MSTRFIIQLFILLFPAVVNAQMISSSAREELTQLKNSSIEIAGNVQFGVSKIDLKNSTLQCDILTFTKDVKMIIVSGEVKINCKTLDFKAVDHAIDVSGSGSLTICYSTKSEPPNAVFLSVGKVKDLKLVITENKQ